MRRKERQRIAQGRVHDLPSPEGTTALKAAGHRFLMQCFESCRPLASHHSLNEVDVDHTSVKAIGPSSVLYRVEGSISVTLQWGSNSGDGIEVDHSFRFHCDLEVPLDDPWALSLAETLYAVDTGKWRDAMTSDE